MTVLDAIVLGLIQGLTEFVPVSSTAHLTLAGKLMGLINTQNHAAWTEFIAIMQVGTLGAVGVYFSSDVVAMVSGVLSSLRGIHRGDGLPDRNHHARLGWLILVGTLPIALIGLAFSKQIHGWFTKSTEVIVASLLILSVLLWIAEKVARHIRVLGELSVKDALIIGGAQAIALVPGSSRSGTTITAGLFLGLTRETAARFSFLLSIPAIFASGVYEAMRFDGTVSQFGYGNLLLATMVAAVSGYASIAWLLKFLARNSTMLFVWYRIVLGLALLLLLRFGLIQP